MDAYLVVVHKNSDNQIEVVSAWASDPQTASEAVAAFLLEEQRDQDLVLGVFDQTDISTMQDLLNQTRAANN